MQNPFNVLSQAFLGTFGSQKGAPAVIDVNKYNKKITHQDQEAKMSNQCE